MSKKIYICKSIINSEIEAIGHDLIHFPASPAITSEKLATTANSLTLSNLPNIYKISKTQRDSTVTSSTLPSKARWEYAENLKLRIKNNNSSSTYFASTYYNTYVKTQSTGSPTRNIKLTFTIEAEYNIMGLSSLIRTHLVSLMSSETPAPGGMYDLAIPEKISNVLYSESYSGYFSLTNFKVNNIGTPAVSSVDGTPLTTAEAVEILKMTSSIYSTSLQYTPIYPSDTTTLFSGTIPSPDGGKLFLKQLKLKELASYPCLHSYGGGYYGNFKIEEFTEPSSDFLWNDSETIYNIYECISTNYRNPKNYLDLVAISGTSSLDSSWQSTDLHVGYYNAYIFNTVPLGMNGYYIEKIAWLDCTFLRFTFSGAGDTRTTSWISVAELIKEGITVAKGELHVSVEVALPDLANLFLNSSDNSTAEIGDNAPLFYPMVPLKLNLDIGFQSDFKTLLDTPVGLYIDTNKVKRLYYGTDEIEYFVADTLTSTTETITVTGKTSASSIPNPLGGTYYTFYKVLPIGSTISSVKVITSTADYTNVEPSGNTISVSLMTTTPSRDVSVTIEYTTKED